MLAQKSPLETKQRIMDAAENIAAIQGARHVTFNELVKQTGLSKGGVLYHFPSKNILLKAMVQRMVNSFRKKREALSLRLSGDGLTDAKTYVMAFFDRNEKDARSSAALMAAAASNPELLGPVREYYAQNFAETRSTANKSALANLIYLATDGLWLLDSLQLCPLDKTEREDLKHLLLKMAELN